MTTPFTDIPRVYLTLACNYRCPYCPQERPPRFNAKLKSGEWLAILNDWPADAIILAGGEPTIHSGFAAIANGLIQPDVRVYSNMSFPAALFDRLKRIVSWYSSFHPSGKCSSGEVARKVVELQRRGHRLLNVHINRAAGDPQQHVMAFARHNLTLEIENDLWVNENLALLRKRALGSVTCRLRRSYFGPDGKRYICVHKLESGDPSGVVDHRNPVAELPCDIHGQCSPCDAPFISVVRR